MEVQTRVLHRCLLRECSIPWVWPNNLVRFVESSSRNVICKRGTFWLRWLQIICFALYIGGKSSTNPISETIWRPVVVAVLEWLEYVCIHFRKAMKLHLLHVHAISMNDDCRPSPSRSFVAHRVWILFQARFRLYHYRLGLHVQVRWHDSLFTQAGANSKNRLWVYDRCFAKPRWFSHYESYQITKRSCVQRSMIQILMQRLEFRNRCKL